MADLIQEVFWPGVVRVMSFSYTCSHGISPGTWSLTTAPQDPTDTKPQRYGSLIVSDGRMGGVFRDMIATDIDGELTAEGITYQIRGYDRRWRWRTQAGGFGGLDGRYNILDQRGKLVPWSIRSPRELAAMCLRAMGEFNTVVELPRGLGQAAGANLDRYLRLGEWFVNTNTNPETLWDKTPPAVALAALADLYGCRIVYQPFTNRILIVPLGKGATLPNTGYEMESPTVAKQTAPRAIGINGAPVGFDFRGRLKPVGPEWDGSVLEIDSLSYAPKVGLGKKHKTEVWWRHGTGVTLPSPLYVTLAWGDKSVTVYSTDPTFTIAQRYAEIIAKFNANPVTAGVFTFAVTGDKMTIEFNKPGVVFTSNAETHSGAPDWFTNTILVQAANGGRGWKSSPPPGYRGVMPTDRLAYLEALEHAKEGVFKWFRLVNEDPADKTKPLTIPGYGTLKRIQQLIIQPTRFAQVTPQPRIAGGADKGNPLPVDPGGVPPLNGGILPEFYNGRSRNAAAVCYGSVWKRLGHVSWFKPNPGDPFDHNTKKTDRVFSTFTVEQHPSGDILVKFSEPVYRYAPSDGAAYLEYPELVLECGAYVQDPDTSQVVRYTRGMDLPGGEAEIEWHNADDVAVAVIGEYGDDHKLKGWKYGRGDREHADAAAAYYLEGYARKYQTVTGHTRDYIGFVRVNPDGAIHQVTWSMDGRGPSTKASRNSEHSAVVPTYPKRRMPELLPPDKAAAAANAADRARVEKLYSTFPI